MSGEFSQLTIRFAVKSSLSELFDRTETRGDSIDKRPMDVRIWYTPADVNDFMTAIDANGQRLYWKTQVSLDVLFPLFFSAEFEDLGERQGSLHDSHKRSNEYGVKRIKLATT